MDDSGTAIFKAEGDVQQVRQGLHNSFLLFGLHIEHQKTTAAVVDHEPMEEVESLFAQLDVYLKARDPVAYCACCASLEVFARAIGESHSVSWWSLL